MIRYGLLCSALLCSALPSDARPTAAIFVEFRRADRWPIITRQATALLQSTPIAMVLLRWRPCLPIPKAELHFRERSLLKRERALLEREQLLDAREAELRGHQPLSSELVGEDNHAAAAAPGALFSTVSA